MNEQPRDEFASFERTLNVLERINFLLGRVQMTFELVEAGRALVAADTAELREKRAELAGIFRCGEAGAAATNLEPA